MAVLSIEHDGQTYSVDIDSITPREFRQIKVHTGISAGAFLRSFSYMGDFDADAAVALLWVGMTRAGKTVTFADFDEVPLFEVVGTLNRHDTPADADGEEGGDPKAGS